MFSSLFFEELIFLSITVILIFFASRLKIGLKRSIYLIFAWLNSAMISTFVIIEFFENGLAPEEIILSIYSFSILGGLIIHFIANLKRRKAYATSPYIYKASLDLNKSQL